ncbi:MAG: M15 family metallopeptidase [Armatimonadota bacterium]|nr:MAG: M15 family metallopeptidase [Armatimonadota bacterium]
MVRSTEWVESTFGRFAWRDHQNKRGAIEILGEWERQNIISIAPPFELRDARARRLSIIRCHRLVASALTRLLNDLKRRGLCHLANSFDGCFVPRHMGWNPRRPLSRHAWGIAVDVNARLFPYGSRAKQDPRFIAAFARQGFAWGGEWRTPDPMHFEVVDLPQPARPLAILLDGERVIEGFLHDGRAVAPVREIAEAMGARVAARIAEGEVEIHTPGGDC